MQTVMLVGMFSKNDDQYTYASSFARTFYTLGHRVITFNNRYQFLPWFPVRFTNWLNNYLINQSLLKQIKKYRPDLLFLIKGENIFPSTLKIIKAQYNPIIINFYPDNPFVVWNGNSTQHLLASLPVYDHFLIWSRMLIPALQSAGCKNVHYFPLAFEEEIFNQIPEEIKPQYRSEVCFVGTWEPAREHWLTGLLERLPNLDLAIWGDLWSKNISPEHILHTKIRGQAVYGEKMLAATQGADIVLNFIREQNATAHNMRTFEVPASGAFLLTQRTHEQAAGLFTEYESIACFENLDELAAQVTFYLHNPDKRKTIAQKAHGVVQQYTLKKQLSQFLSSLDMKQNFYYNPREKGQSRGLE